MSDRARCSISERFAMLRRLAVGLALFELVTCTTVALSTTAPLANFATEQQAQQHGCPRWGDTLSGG